MLAVIAYYWSYWVHHGEIDSIDEFGVYVKQVLANYCARSAQY